MLICHLHSYNSGEVSVKVIGPFFYSSCLFYAGVLSVLCIFWLTVPPEIFLQLRIFAQSVACIFILLNVSFTKQILKFLLKSNLLFL